MKGCPDGWVPGVPVLGPAGVLVDALTVASTRRQRRRGVLGRPPLRPGEGLLLARTRSVHGVGLRAPIRVAFVDRDGAVVHLVDLRPWCITRRVLRAVAALELAADAPVRVGDRLRTGSRLP